MLALHHISSFLAMLVMRYDLVPEEGFWFEPGQDGRDNVFPDCTTNQASQGENIRQRELISRFMGV